jgi:REP element-mobilizing transposase RayT
MPSSYSRLLYHCVFATHGRRELIPHSVARELHPYLTGILRVAQGKILKVGGAKDHLHTLLELAPDVPVATAMRLLKSNSSKWLNARGLLDAPFRWQRGYAAFTVSASALDQVKSYIAGQHEHHKRGGFEEELRRLLGRHGIDPADAWLGT